MLSHALRFLAAYFFVIGIVKLIYALYLRNRQE